MLLLKVSHCCESLCESFTAIPLEPQYRSFHWSEFVDYPQPRLLLSAGQATHYPHSDSVATSNAHVYCYYHSRSLRFAHGPIQRHLLVSCCCCSFNDGTQVATFNLPAIVTIATLSMHHYERCSIVCCHVAP